MVKIIPLSQEEIERRKRSKKLLEIINENFPDSWVKIENHVNLFFYPVKANLEEGHCIKIYPGINEVKIPQELMLNYSIDLCKVLEESENVEYRIRKDYY